MMNLECLIKTFSEFRKMHACNELKGLHKTQKGGDFYLQISVSWQVFKTRCLSSRNQFRLDILQWQILLSISLKHIRKLLLNYLLEQVKATSGQRMTRETSWYTPATSQVRYLRDICQETFGGLPHRWDINWLQVSTFRTICYMDTDPDSQYIF